MLGFYSTYKELKRSQGGVAVETMADVFIVPIRN